MTRFGQAGFRQKIKVSIKASASKTTDSEESKTEAAEPKEAEVDELFRKTVPSEERDFFKRSGKQRLNENGEPAPLYGIGLSGGGIRAASLALGVMQALAENDLLRRFDYISSVSGGGYLAASLQWWWSPRLREDHPSPKNPPSEKAAEFGLGPADFPYGPARPKGEAEAGTTDATTLVGPKTGTDIGREIGSRESEALVTAGRANLAFLRTHSSYLTPGNGLTAWSMVAVVLRTVTISLLTWIPLLIGCFAIIGLLDNLLFEPLASNHKLISPLGSLVDNQWQEPCQDFECDLRYPAIYAFALYLFYGLCLLFVATAVFFALLSRAPQDSNSTTQTLIRMGAAIIAAIGAEFYLYYHYAFRDASIVLLMAAGIIFVVVAIVVIVATLTTPKSLNSSYLLRRLLERLIGWAIIPSLAALAIATIPVLPHYLYQNARTFGAITGIIGVLAGICSALYGYYTFLRSIVPGIAGQIAATFGAIAYLYVTLVTAYGLSVLLLNVTDLKWGDNINPHFAVNAIRIGLLGAIALAVAIATIASINYVGLHRYYRDRLMEVFMPPQTAVANMQVVYSAIADKLSIADLKETTKSEVGRVVARPFPILNTNAIMINDKDHTVATRGGDNFTITPLFVGSSVTGWQDTSEYIKKNGPFTLASATAASGAAANASAGYIGSGITMNPLVSSVMSLLNIRLGLWVGNPLYRKERSIRSIPTFLNPGLVSGIFGRAHHRKSRFIELTDGGHFENLGLYELVRRRLGLILIVDGEADPTISLQALVSATRRIEQDFKASLTFFEGLGPERLIMYPSPGYPAGVRYAESPFVVGKLTYDDGSEGTLVLVKATVIKEMDFTTSGYLASNPDFPHQSTVDQFFSPDQFDAYRYLGYESGLQAIQKLQLVQTISNPKSIIAQYCASRVMPHDDASK